MDYAPTTPLFDDLPVEDAPVTPMRPEPTLVRLGERLPKGVRLGTSSWNFPGWRGIVYAPSSGTRRMASEGLAAYAEHPLFRTVGIDRNFYRPLSAAEFARFGAQVPDDFSFLIKAPRLVTDPFLRHEGGRIAGVNPNFLDVRLTRDRFLNLVESGLGDKAGPLVFEISPWPRGALRKAGLVPEVVENIGRFFEALAETAVRPQVMAAEFRNPELLTPRMMRTLRRVGVRPVLGLHPSMPDVRRQISALRWYETEAGREETVGLSDDWRFSGPLIVRWSLAQNQFFEQARREWSPFDKIVSPDPATRTLLAALIVRAARSGQPVWAVANNKAEGCAPLTMRAMAESIVNLWASAEARETRAQLEEEARLRREAGRDSSCDPSGGPASEPILEAADAADAADLTKR